MPALLPQPAAAAVQPADSPPDWVVEMVVTLDSAGAGVVVLGGDAAGVKSSLNQNLFPSD